MKRKSNLQMITDLENMYDVNDVKLGFNYWLSKLLQITLGIFDYKGLPNSISQKDIETQLQLYGHCVVFENNGELVTCRTTLFDVGKYYEPIKFSYAQPKIGGGSYELNTFNNVVIYNTLIEDNLDDIYFDNTLITIVARYARMLADTESSYNFDCVNIRNRGFPIAKDDSVRASLNKFFNKLRLGFYEIVGDTQIIESFAYKTDTNMSKFNGLDILTCRDKILEQFYRDIGIKFTNQKRAQVNKEEVESDTQVLLVNLDGMLAERKKGIERLNEMFNLNVSVELNEKFKRDSFVDGYNLND